MENLTNIHRARDAICRVADESNDKDLLLNNTLIISQIRGS